MRRNVKQFTGNIYTIDLIAPDAISSGDRIVPQ